MLVLSRKPGETIHIGEHIVIKLQKVKGASCRIAIDAPQEMVVRRGELRTYDRRERGKETQRQPPATNKP